MGEVPTSRWIKGALVSIVVAGLVVGGSALVTPDGSPTRIADLGTDELGPDRVLRERLAATGEISPEVRVENGSGTVLLDAAHGNRFDRAGVTPLVEAIGRAGYSVRLAEGDSFREALNESEAAVIIDPAEPYTEEELDALEAFVEDGGRLLILGEPTRVSVSLSLFGASISPKESALTGVANRFDLAFDTRYVYDLSRHDGNYKRPLATPTREGAAASIGRNLSTVGNVSLYTATTVRSLDDGVPILATYDSARLAESDRRGPFPVAVQDGRVLAIGDSTFAGAAYFAVADNEVFLTEVLEFLVTGERIYRPQPADGDPGNMTATGQVGDGPEAEGGS